MKIFFIRHGETDINRSGKMHTVGDAVKLTKDGIEQIKKLIPVLQENKVEKIFCSPEVRAVESAKILSDTLGASFEILNELQERNWGDFENRSWGEIEVELDQLSLEERYQFVPPKGESWMQMEDRLRLALHVVSNDQSSNVGVVTHEGALRALMPIIKNEDRANSLGYNFDNGSVTAFDLSEGIFSEIVLD